MRELAIYKYLEFVRYTIRFLALCPMIRFARVLFVFVFA